MHILFIHPATESLGIEYLSAVLRGEGHKVSLLFDPQVFQSFRFSVPSLHNNNTLLLARMAIQLAPDIICFSVGSDYLGWALRTAGSIKNFSSTPIIFGGIHPTTAPEAVLQNDAVDYVCVGEGEKALVELLHSIQHRIESHSIDNIWFKKEGIIYKAPVRGLEQNLDHLPFPDKELFYRCFPAFVTGAYMIISGRGCVNACSYCHNSALRQVYCGKGQYYRRRSVENVISELEHGLKRYQFRRVSFCDDIFTADTSWLKEFAIAYAKRIHRPYYCAVHPANIDEERISLLVKSGCSVVNLGIQTIDPELRRECLYRNETTQEVVNVLSLFSKTNIFLYTNFIFGLPDQDLEELEEIALFCGRHKADFHDVNWLRYYPGTSIVNIAREKGVFRESELAAIDSGLEFKPYAHGGHGFSKQAAKIRNFIFLSHFLTFGIVNWVIRHKGYRILPAVNMRHVLVILRILWQEHIGRKRAPYPNFSLYDSFCYYWHFILNKPIVSSER